MQYLTNRVIDLRHLLQVTQTDLASSIDIDASYVSKMEQGTRALTREIAERLSLRYQLPMSFFLAEDPLPNVAAPTFRKKANTSVREANYVHVLQKLAMRLFHQVSIDTEYLTWNHPIPHEVTDPEAAASLAREHFGLSPTEPVRNVTRLLERSGIAVISSLDPTGDEQLAKRYHGVSRPNQDDNRPLVALFDTGRGDVNRLTLAHELGHIVLDRYADGLAPHERETRAFRFAGAFLLPAAIVADWITPDLPLSGYLAIKSQYGISASAAIRRGLDLGLVTQDRYRSLMIQHSSRGWRTAEPGHVEVEQSILLGQAVTRASSGSILPARAAADASGVPLRHVSHWTGLPSSTPPNRPSADAPNVIDFAAARARRAA